MAAAAATVTTRVLASPAMTHIPVFIWGAISVLNKVHRVWSAFRIVNVYFNPDNFNKLFIGHVLNMLIGDMFLIRLAGQVVLISNRLLLCLSQIKRLSYACERWKLTLRMEYPYQKLPVWDCSKTARWYSASTAYYFQKTCYAPFDYIKRMVICTAVIFKEVFLLSMYTMDLLKALSKTASENNAVNEMLVNATGTLDQLVPQLENAQQQLRNRKNAQAITFILAKIHKDFKIRHLRVAVDNMLSATKKAQYVVNCPDRVMTTVVRYASSAGLYSPPNSSVKRTISPLKASPNKARIRAELFS